MTYLRDAYVYDSQEIPRPPVVPGPFNESPTMMLVGEIACLDGHTVLIPQPVKFQEYRPDDGLTWTGVMDAFVETPQNHAKGRITLPQVPVWPVVLIVLGLALMAFGWLLNEPVSLLIYTAIHRS